MRMTTSLSGLFVHLYDAVERLLMYQDDDVLEAPSLKLFMRWRWFHLLVSSLFLPCSIMFSKALPVAAARFWQINNIRVNAAAAH